MEKLKINSIYNINCLDGIKKIPDNSIDTVICDPPYFQGLTYNGKKSEFIDLITAEPFFKELSYEINRILNEEAG